MGVPNFGVSPEAWQVPGCRRVLSQEEPQVPWAPLVGAAGLDHLWGPQTHPDFWGGGSSLEGPIPRVPGIFLGSRFWGPPSPSPPGPRRNPERHGHGSASPRRSPAPGTAPGGDRGFWAPPQSWDPLLGPPKPGTLPLEPPKPGNPSQGGTWFFVGGARISGNTHNRDPPLPGPPEPPKKNTQDLGGSQDFGDPPPIPKFPSRGDDNAGDPTPPLTHSPPTKVPGGVPRDFRGSQNFWG